MKTKWFYVERISIKINHLAFVALPFYFFSYYFYVLENGTVKIVSSFSHLILHFCYVEIVSSFSLMASFIFIFDLDYEDSRLILFFLYSQTAANASLSLHCHFRFISSWTPPLCSLHAVETRTREDCKKKHYLEHVGRVWVAPNVWLKKQFQLNQFNVRFSERFE